MEFVFPDPIKKRKMKLIAKFNRNHIKVKSVPKLVSSHSFLFTYDLIKDNP
jgi:hypothetical protein